MRLALAAALLALAAGPSFAQTSPPPATGGDPMVAAGRGGHAAWTPEQRAAREAMRQACAADTQTLCADAQTEGHRPMQCLRQHMSDLSPGCAQAIQAMRAGRHDAGGASPSPPPA